MTSANSSKFFAPCPRGLEQVLVDELVKLNAGNPESLQGGVSFVGSFDLCYQVNLVSRIANRVLWEISHGPYCNEEDIYRAAFSLPWPSWFGVKNRIKVNINSKNCPLRSLDFLTLRVKDAICDHFRKVVGARPNIDTRMPDIGIYVFLDHSTITFYLDTTGTPLFKRGFRGNVSEAPLRRNLAAGILRIAGWTPNHVLLDPMCGSGTFLLEAAQIAENIAPGLGRHFAFEKFHHFHSSKLKYYHAACLSQQQSSPSLAIYGYDKNHEALEAARINFRGCGLARLVKLEQLDILKVPSPSSEGIIVSNPPYGLRSGKYHDLEDWYPRLGDMLKKKFVGWRAFFITADRRLQELIGLSTMRKTPLFNGGIECRLLEYPITAGSHRKKRKSFTLRS